MVMDIDDEVEEEVQEGYEDREYQTVGTQFLDIVRRGWLTDDPGLGKTPQAIRASELPVQIVAPKYLTEQWVDAIRREHPDAVIGHADGTRTMRDKILSKRADWYVTNYQMIPTYDMPTGIRTYINDEAHHLRNRSSTYSQAVNIMENDNPNVKARIYHLTATPFWKTVDDIWHPANILYPEVFPSYHNFVKLYCTSLSSPYGPKVVGVRRSMRGELKELFSLIMLGRTYKDVGRFLPDTVESYVKFKLPNNEQQMYDKLLREYSLKWEDEEEQKKLIFQPTTLLHVLRQVTFYSGKVDAVLGILEDNYTKPAVIGFWYKDHARAMYDRIKNNAVLITGDMDATERHRLARWAQRNGKHIVASQQSLAEGINLSDYRLFIFGEENYIPGSNHQFLSRVVRDRNDGGKDQEPVRVFYVQARKTIDETIHSVSKRRKMANSATRELLAQTFKR